MNDHSRMKRLVPRCRQTLCLGCEFDARAASARPRLAKALGLARGAHSASAARSGRRGAPRALMKAPRRMAAPHLPLLAGVAGRRRGDATGRAATASPPRRGQATASHGWHGARGGHLCPAVASRTKARKPRGARQRLATPGDAARLYPGKGRRLAPCTRPRARGLPEHRGEKGTRAGRKQQEKRVPLRETGVRSGLGGVSRAAGLCQR